jgi:hypothetical protein
MDSKNEARIIQNLIDEAEENYAKIIEALAHPRNNAQIAQRRKDIDEGIALVGELNAPEAPRDELIGTIREGLKWLQERYWKSEHKISKAYQSGIAALDQLAAQKPKVPLDLLEELSYHTYGPKVSIDSRRAIMSEIAARYGVEVE